MKHLDQFKARDGSLLSYRFYDSSIQEKVIILIHDASLEGEYLDPFATFLSESGQVYLPNLRGHYASGKSYGHCSYIGQLENDLYDYIQHFDLQGKKIYLAGHLRGAGLALRFAESVYGNLIEGFILLSPKLAKVSTLKIRLINLLNLCKLKTLNRFKVIDFPPNPEGNGCETLYFSYNLHSSFYPSRKALKKFQDRILIIDDFSMREQATQWIEEKQCK